jgi:hypothetical protein
VLQHGSVTAGPGFGKPPAAGRKAMGEACAEYGQKWTKMDGYGRKILRGPLKSGLQPGV